jgi:arylsulfatase A-like enzyme
MPDRPNVLLVVTDQQQAGTVAGSDFRTPNLDRIAERGARFDGAYATHPQCSPSRSSMVTGQFPHQTGVDTLSNWGPYDLDPGSESVGRAFSEAGYETAWCGRWDLGADNITALGWETVRNLDTTGSPGRRGRTRDDATAAAAEAVIADADEPFFCTASFNLPHPAWFLDEAFADEYDADAVPVPDSFDEDRSDKPAFVRNRAADLDLTREAVREVGRMYRTMVARVDAFVGRLLDALDDRGIREETVVAFVADHGDMQGAHGLAKKGCLPYEEVLRVPFLLDVPGRTPSREVVPDLVSLAALPGTLADAAGVDASFEGGSVLDALDRAERPAAVGDGERVFFEHRHAYWGSHPLRGVRTPDWKYVEYLGDEGEELYHLAADPGETENLAGERPEAETRLRGLVEDWWEHTGGDQAAWAGDVELSE